LAESNDIGIAWFRWPPSDGAMTVASGTRLTLALIEFRMKELAVDEIPHQLFLRLLRIKSKGGTHKYLGMTFTIHWKALEEHFLMMVHVSLVFDSTIFGGCAFAQNNLSPLCNFHNMSPSFIMTLFEIPWFRFFPFRSIINGGLISFRFILVTARLIPFLDNRISKLTTASYYLRQWRWRRNRFWQIWIIRQIVNFYSLVPIGWFVGVLHYVICTTAFRDVIVVWFA
jgi:hypothetical protein